MKKFMLLVLFVTPFANAAPKLDTYVCKSQAQKGVMGGSEYQVIVKETASLNPGKYDYIRKANLIVAVRPLGTAVSTFRTIVKGSVNAYITDVVYRIVDRNLGVSMTNFLDEMDEATITIYQRSSKLQVRLSCDYAR